MGIEEELNDDRAHSLRLITEVDERDNVFVLESIDTKKIRERDEEEFWKARDDRMPGIKADDEIKADIDFGSAQQDAMMQPPMHTTIAIITNCKTRCTIVLTLYSVPFVIHKVTNITVGKQVFQHKQSEN